MTQLTENTRPGARGLILPPQSMLGNPAENTLLPDTVAELERLGLSPREIAVDGGFHTGSTSEAFSTLEPERLFISGRQQPGSRRTQRRLQRYGTGCEGRISHLKRGYGLGRSRLERRPGPADLDRLVDPRLQPRHTRHPNPLKHERS